MLESFLFVPEVQFGSNCYVLKSGGEYCVIDPSVSFGAVLEQFPDITENLRYIILTHSHFDHILSLDEWVAGTSVTPSMSSAASDNIKDSKKNCYRLFFRLDKVYSGDTVILSDGDLLPFGDTSLRIIETPGHTSGSVCIVADDTIFVGDTLFSCGSYGRCDLPTGSSSLLRESIDKILGYPDNFTLLCGHGDSTTVKEAKKYSYL